VSTNDYSSLLEPLAGRSLIQFCVGAGVRLDLDGPPYYEITIECPLTITAMSIEGAEPTTPAVLAALRELLMTTALSVTQQDGHLTITFDQASITVPPNDNFEAWQIRSDDGLLIVCTPGGDLAVWTPG
jgi:hypothetical protein